jgi:hypothetical protein
VTTVTDKYEETGHNMISACKFSGVIEDFVLVGFDTEWMDLEPLKIN